MTQAQKAAPGTFTGLHMWIFIIGFFGVVISVNVLMAVLSQTSWTGLVVENSYVASQEFEVKRLAHEQQIAAGWTSTFSYANGEARLHIVDATGKPVELGDVTLLVNRPVGGHDDQTLTLTRTPEGDYVTPLKVKNGFWAALVTAPNSAKGYYELDERFNVEGATP